ncbi:MAG: hypothetical protein ACLQOO_04305 [Terriglobia bacterium]
MVEEVRAAREAYAVRFNYDLAEMYRNLKTKEQARNRNIAPLQPVEPQPDATAQIEVPTPMAERTTRGSL